MYRGERPGYVILADGSIFRGFGFGAEGQVLGEIVFNTGMTGYQEMVTDPSYHGQMITFTYPLIGNYGAADELFESDHTHSRAIVVRESKNSRWNQSCPEFWEDWLTAHGVVGVGGVDTRALTRHIREQGAMAACVAAGPQLDPAALLAAAQALPPMSGRDLASVVTCRQPYVWLSADRAVTPRLRVVALDFGIKRSILKSLAAVGCETTVVPATYTAEQVLALEPQGVFLSNGPGDPAAVSCAVETIRGLLGHVPVFGICLGHQLLARAIGLSTYKLKFGHRGANHPVRNYLTGRVEITSQNHGFAVEPPAVVKEALARGAVLGQEGVASLRAKDMLLESQFGPVQVSHLNLNDGTVEGLQLLELPVFSVQYHPEAGPGPHDSRYLFREFVDQIESASSKLGGTNQ